MTATLLFNELSERGFTFSYKDDGLFVKPTSKLRAADIAAIKEYKTELLRLIEPPMLRPRLTANGELRIPWQAHPRFHHWAGGQSLWTTLAELNAPASVIRKYTSAVDKLHSGLQQCSGRVVELASLKFCVECGWREETAKDFL